MNTIEIIELPAEPKTENESDDGTEDLGCM